MAQIIEFKKSKKVEKPGKNRVEALVKGRIRVFTCDECGARIEVINGEYPDRCPGCNREITKWKNSEE